jgi:hypothetical protein
MLGSRHLLAMTVPVEGCGLAIPGAKCRRRLSFDPAGFDDGLGDDRI